MGKTKYKKVTWQTKLANIWSRYMPPARPSKSELKIFAEYIKKTSKQSQILILGATPEFRNLVLKYKRIPISADLNPKNFKAFKKFIKYRGKEQFIQGNWLGLKKRNEFNLILGHASFNMLPFSDWNKLTKVIYDSLKPNGILIHVVNVRYPKDKHKNILDIFERYRRKRKKGPIYYEIMVDLLLTICDTKKNYADFETLGRKLTSLYKSKKITEEEYLGIVDVRVSRALKLTFPLKSKVDYLFRKHFPKVIVCYGKDPFSKNCPIYILRKK